ncbi:hypothetical protein ACFL5F_00610 [Planctomycetota bacterium]
MHTRIKGRQTTRIITERIIYPSIVVKPIHNPEKMKVIAMAGYRIDLEEIFKPLLVSLIKKAI